MVVQAAVFIPIAAWMGFDGEQMVALVVMLAAFTLTGLIYLRRTIGLIR